MTTPEVEWVIPELLPAKDATMIVGSPKVGKTRLAFEVVRTILQQQECISFKPCRGKPPVILVSDDQSAGDTAATPAHATFSADLSCTLPALVCI